MDFVFFGEDLASRGPDVIGHVYDSEGSQWVSMLEVTVALLEGKNVSIRQATATELKRAAALITLHAAGYEIALCIHQLMDQNGPDAINSALTDVCGMMESLDAFVPFQLLDQ